MATVEPFTTDFDLDDPVAARLAIRQGTHTGQTAGLANGYTQGNLAILPANLAMDFLRYCQRNPKPCPLVGVSDTGEPALPTLGRDIDIRTDIPSYNVYRDGELAEQVPDIRDLWQDDFVAFIIGCSFSFEEALVNEGVPLRHWELNSTASKRILTSARLSTGASVSDSLTLLSALPPLAPSPEESPPQAASAEAASRGMTDLKIVAME